MEAWCRKWGEWKCLEAGGVQSGLGVRARAKPARSRGGVAVGFGAPCTVRSPAACGSHLVHGHPHGGLGRQHGLLR